MATTAITTVYATCDKHHHVWWATPRSGAKYYPGVPDDFLKEEICDVDELRIVGTVHNAPLICTAYAATVRRERGEVYLGSPQLARTQQEREHPETLLLRSRQAVPLAPSQGGWHLMQGAELSSYGLAWKYHTNFTTVNHEAEFQTLLEHHPAWSLLQFVQGLHAESTAKLLGLIRDPRWFVAPSDRKQPAKLMAFLGVCPHTQAAVNGTKEPFGHVDRCRLVRDCWKTWNVGDRADQTNSRDWLHREWIYKRAMATDADRVEATVDARISQRFLVFLWSVWLDALYRKQRDPLMDPSIFFRDPAIAQDFALFRSSTTSQ